MFARSLCLCCGGEKKAKNETKKEKNQTFYAQILDGTDFFF